MRKFVSHNRVLTAAVALTIFTVCLPALLDIATLSMFEAESAELESKESKERVEVDDIDDVVCIFNQKVVILDADSFFVRMQLQHDHCTSLSSCSPTSRGPPVA